ncbi:MAG: hypothetical protein EHM14_11705 [Methanothrix sp.]|nr:MAG: hypothetical protein EHM14_11705 [Methanothrix sp.]
MIMTDRSSTIIMKLCASDGEKVGLEDAGKLLISLQDLAWHTGSFLEGQPFSEGGRLKKLILDNYCLQIKSMHSGSVVVEVEPAIQHGQSELDSFQKFLPPGPRVITKITDLIEAVEGDDGRDLEDVIPDFAYRSRLLLDVLNLHPKRPGYTLYFEGQGDRVFKMDSSNRSRIEELVLQRKKQTGEEIRLGLLADLRVDPEKVMKIERIGEKFQAFYPSELEANARELLGHPIKVTGRAERFSGSPKIKNFYVDKIEPFESYALEEFEIDSHHFMPKKPIEITVEYDDGLWILSLPYIDAVGYSNDYYEAEDLLHDYLEELWSEYVTCPEEELGETGKLLREMLLDLFEVN